MLYRKLILTSHVYWITLIHTLHIFRHDIITANNHSLCGISSFFVWDVGKWSIKWKAHLTWCYKQVLNCYTGAQERAAREVPGALSDSFPADDMRRVRKMMMTESLYFFFLPSLLEFPMSLYAFMGLVYRQKKREEEESGIRSERRRTTPGRARKRDWIDPSSFFSLAHMLPSLETLKKQEKRSEKRGKEDDDDDDDENRAHFPVGGAWYWSMSFDVFFLACPTAGMIHWGGIDCFNQYSAADVIFRGRTRRRKIHGRICGAFHHAAPAMFFPPSLRSQQPKSYDDA